MAAVPPVTQQERIRDVDLEIRDVDLEIRGIEESGTSPSAEVSERLRKTIWVNMQQEPSPKQEPSPNREDDSGRIILELLDNSSKWRALSRRLRKSMQLPDSTPVASMGLPHPTLPDAKTLLSSVLTPIQKKVTLPVGAPEERVHTVMHPRLSRMEMFICDLEKKGDATPEILAIVREDLTELSADEEDKDRLVERLKNLAADLALRRALQDRLASYKHPEGS